MVGDDHQVAHKETFVHTTGGIADEECLDAQFVHHTDGEGHFFHRVALIVVEAALHSHNIHASQLAEDQLAAVTFDRRYREVGNVRIGNFVGVSYF